MAKVIPDGWRELAAGEAGGAAERELATLALLERGLPAAYTVYHGVHWTRLDEGGFSIYGDIDFVVVNAAGELLAIEQRSGFLEEGPQGLSSRRRGRDRNVAVGIARSRTALQARLAARLGGPVPRIEYLLYCPDYFVRQAHTAGIEPERIVDAAVRDQLIPRIRAILPPGEHSGHAPEVHRFLRDEIKLEPDVAARLGIARERITRVAGGLSQWARALDFDPYRLRVVGTAGSGKTQLALAEYSAAIAAGRRPLYVCFNRPLADHLAHIAPEGGLACTFHHLCERVLAAHGERPDYAKPDAFDALIARAGELEVPDDLRFDSIIVDEGQDFSADWAQQLWRHAADDDARRIWLEDPMQNLYARPPIELPGWVTLRAHSNFRSPRPVVRMLQALLPAAEHIEAASPFEADEVELLAYDTAHPLTTRVKEAIRLCFAAGFHAQDVAIISWRGREQSELLRHDRLGANALRSFTGQYDLLGQPEYSGGEVLIESVYRFKGQSAPAVILAEIDFETLDERTLRKLFVGATRAMMKLVLVASERAAAQLRDKLGAHP
ncbi:MAG: ATP-dependent helicase [Methyloversatilis sp.]|uniref:ATP-dependent helicase n=1 Tax=Methyloversatilis discipulorum TaxID=1119528 RepID=UPI0019B0997C|nr:ATP-dependent helicase [Methyloversatilis discipulorum]MBC7207357.1 ATP-dependent helicase [Methyloversatilis sp.]MBT9518479.1 ATP-dependent helicase [Methyloversatilis discipulorum]